MTNELLATFLWGVVFGIFTSICTILITIMILQFVKNRVITKTLKQLGLMFLGDNKNSSIVNSGATDLVKEMINRTGKPAEPGLSTGEGSERSTD